MTRPSAQAAPSRHFREQPKPETAEVAAQQQGDGRAGGRPHPGGKSDRPVAPAARTGSLTVPHAPTTEGTDLKPILSS